MWLFGFHIHFMWNFAVQSLSMIIYFFLSKYKDLLTSFAWWKKKNKNTLTGPANCKKTNRHHDQLSSCAKSRKTNDAKSRKWPKTSIWAFFWRFRGQISPNCKFVWKIGFFQIEGHIYYWLQVKNQKNR